MNLPVEFTKRMELLLKEEYEPFLQSYKRPVASGLRVNLLKGSADEYKNRTSFELEAIPWVEEGFYYARDARPGKSVFHEAGACYIQEPSAMAVAVLADAKPGEKVLDLCAAPGGKTTQLASAMKGEGILISNEIHPARAKILSQNVERMGIRNAIVLNESPDVLSERFSEYFDCIVVDAPCSGEGMFKKEEEALAHWSMENIEMCAHRQREILKEAVRMLAPGGRLIYSTCTFAPEENEENVIFLLDEYEDLKVLPRRNDLARFFAEGFPKTVNGREEVRNAYRLMPHQIKGEGHFMCAFIKEGERTESSVSENRKGRRNSEKEGFTKAEKVFLEEFLEEILKEEARGFICKEALIKFGNRLFLLPENINLKDLKVLRAGLELGTFEKNRFEPAHALAMALKPNEAKKVLSLSSKEGEAYIRGESLPCKEKGWVLVSIEGYSCGFGKGSNGMLKNHYPKGLRRDISK